MSNKFVSVATSTLDGQAYVRFQDAYSQTWDIYPEGRISPAEAWSQLQNVIGFQSGIWFSVTYDGKLNVVSYSSSFTLIFSTSALATYFGFNSVSNAGTQYVWLAANNVMTTIEFEQVGAVVNESNDARPGHGHGALGRNKRKMTLDIIGTRSNAATFVTAMEQNGFVGFIDSYGGGLPWTVRVESLKFSPVGTTKARLQVSGPVRY